MNCPNCQTPYLFSSRVNAEIPTCPCLQDRAAEEAAQARVLAHEESAMERVMALRLGVMSDHDKKAPTVQGWEAPHIPILASRNLVVTGSPGTRKTTLLKQIAYHAALQGLKVRGGYVIEMLSTLKDMDRVKDYSAWLEHGHVLILDDLDKLLGTQYEIERLMLLIDRYWAFKRSIVVSLNMSPDELQQKMGSARGDHKREAEAIFSRLMGAAKVVVLEGNDFRLHSMGKA